MKKFLISFFSILLIALASVGGGLLLSGCDNPSYSETNGEGNLDNSENEIPSDDEDDVSAQYLCYIAECITRLGSPAQSIMQKVLGVRITANVKTFGCL